MHAAPRRPAALLPGHWSRPRTVFAPLRRLRKADASGGIQWKKNYYPFGEPGILHPNASGPEAGSANNNDLGFAGHIDDGESGLSYMQARYYDPILGRFLSPDPVQFGVDRPDMFNRYAYAANDPVNLIDPDGRAPQHVMDQRSRALANSVRNHPKQTAIVGGLVAAVVATQMIPGPFDEAAAVGVAGKIGANVGNELLNSASGMAIEAGLGNLSAAPDAQSNSLMVEIDGQQVDLNADPTAGTSTGTLQVDPIAQQGDLHRDRNAEHNQARGHAPKTRMGRIAERVREGLRNAKEFLDDGGS